MNWRNYLSLSVLCMLTLVGCKAYSDSEEKWSEFLRKIGVEHENVLCEGQQAGDRFLIALVNKKLLTAYRVDVTGESGKLRPSIISWSFRNENGVGLETNIPPKIIIKQIAKEQGKLYSERADYRHLILENSVEVEVRFGTQKEQETVEVPREGPYDLRNLKSVLVCTIPVENLQ